MSGSRDASASNLADKSNNSSHAYHTLLKLGLQEIRVAIDADDPMLVGSKMKDFERVMSKALIEFPEESFILDAEAQYRELLKERPAALGFLEKAFESNKRSPYIALRLASSYLSR